MNIQRILFGSGIILLILIIILIFFLSKGKDDPIILEDDISIEEPIEETIEETIEEPIEETIEETIEEPIEETIEEPIKDQIEEEEEEEILKNADEPVQSTSMADEETLPSQPNTNEEEENEARKETIVPKAIEIDNNNYTNYYDDGKGNTVYLDGLDVDCKNSNFIKSFSLENKDNKNRYKFMCNKKIESFENNIEHYTSGYLKKFTNLHRETLDNDEGGGNVAFLDRHHVKCDKGLLTKFKLGRNGKKYQYNYKCLTGDAKSKLKTFPVKQTSKVIPTKKTTDLIDKQMNCYDPNDPDVGLTSFLYKNGDGKAWYDYVCGKIVPKTEEDFKKEKAIKDAEDKAVAVIKAAKAAAVIKAAADKKAADKKAADKKAADKKAADKKAADKKAADKKAADKKAADKKVADKKAADKKVADKKAATDRINSLKKAANKSPPTGAGPYLYPPTGITYQVSSAHDNGKHQHFTPWINSKQGWSSKFNKNNQWFNMKFKEQYVKNIRIQGRVGGAHGQYLTQYNLYYKNKDNHWIFKGRKMTYSKGDAIQVNPVNEITKEIQLNIMSWKNHITFRADLEFGGHKPKSLTWLRDGLEIRFKSHHKNKYIRGFSNGTVGSGGAGSEEIFICKPLTGAMAGKWAFFNKSHKRFLRANGARDMDLSIIKKDKNDIPTGWRGEAFVVMDAGDGKVGLLTHFHYYVGVSDKGDAYQGQAWKDIEKEKWMKWERFEIVPVSIPKHLKKPRGFNPRM